MRTILYDVFISYRHADVALATRVAAELKRRGVRVWFDVNSMEYGLPLRDQLERAIAQSLACAFVLPQDRSEDTANWYNLEVSRALHTSVREEPRLRIIPLVFLRDSAGGFISDFPWIDFSDPSQFDSGIESLVRSLKGNWPARFGLADRPTLPELLAGARQSLVISGHTLDKFIQNREVRRVLEDRMETGVAVTLILLNPECPYAVAREPFHRDESRTSSLVEIHQTLEGLRSLFLINNKPPTLRVYLSNYMPRFRTILIDDAECHASLYMYGTDVAPTPDLILKTEGNQANDSLFGAIQDSLQQLLRSVDVVPFIANGTLDESWNQRHIARSYLWNADRRLCITATRAFYSNHAVPFREKFGDRLEHYVQDFLDDVADRGRRLGRPIVVLGCGAGKEVRYLADRGCRVRGLDFAIDAIEEARRLHPDLAQQFALGDFFDLGIEPTPDGGFGGLVANAAFVHLPDEDDLVLLLRAMYQKVAVGGKAFIRVLNKQGVESEWDPRLFNANRWFRYFDLPRLAALSRAARFTVERIEEFRHESYAGVSWPCILLSRSN